MRGYGRVRSKGRTAKTLLIREIERTAARLHGVPTGKLVRAYWWSGRRNFGDLLTPFLLRRVGLVPLHVRSERAQVILAGSVLTALSRTFHGVVVGAGAVRDGPPIDLPKARVLAVRGRLSWERIGQPSGVVLADPGLLLGRSFTREPKFDLGVLPHYLDKHAPMIQVFRSNPRVKVIDVERGPIKVAADIASCQLLASSSLHGIIAADAIGIPSVWFCESKQLVGGSYKFEDYGSSVGRVFESVSLTGRESLGFYERVTMSADPQHVRELAAQLDCVIAGLPTLLASSDGSGP